MLDTNLTNESWQSTDPKQTQLPVVTLAPKPVATPLEPSKTPVADQPQKPAQQQSSYQTQNSFSSYISKGLSLFTPTARQWAADASAYTNKLLVSTGLVSPENKASGVASTDYKLTATTPLLSDSSSTNAPLPSWAGAARYFQPNQSLSSPVPVKKSEETVVAQKSAVPAAQKAPTKKVAAKGKKGGDNCGECDHHKQVAQQEQAKKASEQASIKAATLTSAEPSSTEEIVLEVKMDVVADETPIQEVSEDNQAPSVPAPVAIAAQPVEEEQKPQVNNNEAAPVYRPVVELPASVPAKSIHFASLSEGDQPATVLTIPATIPAAQVVVGTASTQLPIASKPAPITPRESQSARVSRSSVKENDLSAIANVAVLASPKQVVQGAVVLDLRPALIRKARKQGSDSPFNSPLTGQRAIDAAGSNGIHDESQASIAKGASRAASSHQKHDDVQVKSTKDETIVAESIKKPLNTVADKSRPGHGDGEGNQGSQAHERVKDVLAAQGIQEGAERVFDDVSLSSDVDLLKANQASSVFVS